MFKTLCHIIISLLLLLTTTGMVVSKHFCDEFLISTSLFADAESCCGDGACCHNETQFFQLKENFQPSFTNKIPCSVEIELISFEIRQLVFENTPGIYQTAFVETEPPPPPKLQTFLSLRQVYLL